MPARSRLVCFIATADAQRARAFYHGKLGLALVEDGGYALVFDANGTQLRGAARAGRGAASVHGARLGGRRRHRRRARAGRQRRADGALPRALPLDADGVWDTPDGSRVAWFHDPDGNTLSLSQPPKDREPSSVNTR